jgi:hypothetical protein
VAVFLSSAVPGDGGSARREGERQSLGVPFYGHPRGFDVGPAWPAGFARQAPISVKVVAGGQCRYLEPDRTPKVTPCGAFG